MEGIDPGWYGDPAPGAPPGSMRYWDGGQWTEHVHYAEPAAASEPMALATAGDQSVRRSRPLLMIGLGLVLAAAVAGSWLVLANQSDDTGAGSDFATLLGFVPDAPDYRSYVIMTNYERARQNARLDKPDVGDADEVLDYLVDLTTRLVDDNGTALPAATPVAFGLDPLPIEAWRDEFGYSIFDATAAVDAGQQPNNVAAQLVTVSSEDIDRAVRSDPTWSSELSVDDHRGTSYYQWGPDGETRFDLDRTPGRPLSRGGQLAIIDDIAVRTIMDSVMQDVISHRSDGRSIADIPEALAVVSALDEQGVHSLFLTDQPQVASPDLLLDLDADSSAAEILANRGTGLLPYRWLGAGTALVDGTALNVIVLSNPSAEAASENAGRLRSIVGSESSLRSAAPWSDTYRIRSIEASGDLTVAVLEVLPERNPNTWLQAFFTRDSLYLVGD